MTRSWTRLTILAVVAVMVSVGGIVVVSSNGGSAAVAAGNKSCPPNKPPASTSPSSSPTKAPPVTYPENCVLPYLPGWRPSLGVVFNDPLGSKSDATRIVRRVINAINHTPKGDTIRIAVYSFDRGDVASALRKAKKRKVNVQIAVNAKVMSGTARSLQKLLGKNPRKKSFLVACDGACRSKGSGGNLHSKVYSFSRTGGARGLVIVSSGNLTSKAVYRQWNDSFGISQDTGLFGAWVKMFNQIKLQKRYGSRTISYNSASRSFRAEFSKVAAGGQSSSTVTPATTTTTARTSAKYRASSDPVLSRLKKVTCKAPSGFGKKGRTVLRISMYAMFKSRGETLAKQLVKLKKSGCDIMMIMSVPGGKTSRMMSDAKIPLRSADWMFNERDPLVEDGIGGYGPSFYSHYKVMALNGMFEGKPTKTVWTGSENWGAISFANEEVVLRVNNAKTYSVYAKQFNAMWKGRATHRMGLKPLHGP